MAAPIELGIQGLTYYKLRKGCLSLYTQTHLVTDAILEVGTVIRLLQASVFCNQMIIKALEHISLVLHNVYTISDTGKVHYHFWCQDINPLAIYLLAIFCADLFMGLLLQDTGFII